MNTLANLQAEVRNLSFIPPADAADMTDVTPGDQSSAFATPAVDATTTVNNREADVVLGQGIVLLVNSGGTATNTKVNSGGVVNVASGGVENGGTQMAGGIVIVSSGARVSDMTISGGVGGLAQGCVRSVVSRTNAGYTITFDLTDTRSGFGTSTTDRTTPVIDTDPVLASTISRAVSGQDR